MKIIAVIPARYKSSRFQGKPLADLLGKPMLWWVYQKVKAAKGIDDIFVATDNEIIENMCKKYGMNVIMTADTHPTGVDRLSEVSHKVNADFYLLVQGDEPLLETASIEDMVQKIRENPDKECVRTFKTPLKNPVDAVNNTIIKIVTDLNNNILFASRSAIPYPKAAINFVYYKSVGIYAYPRDILLNYSKTIKGVLESAEDHDFMRMLENGIKMKAYPRETDTISVDTPKDLERVRKIMEERKNEINI